LGLKIALQKGNAFDVHSWSQATAKPTEVKVVAHVMNLPFGPSRYKWKTAFLTTFEVNLGGI
jgi:hypothetical protein